MPEISIPVYPTPLRTNATTSSMAGATQWNQSTPGYLPEGMGSNDGVPVTDAQVRFDPTTGRLPHYAGYYSRYSRRWLDFDKLRAMRRDPTIALARETAVAPIVASPWTVETTDNQVSEEIKVAVERYLLPFRQRWMRCTLLGEIDFGWRAYEKVFIPVRDTQLGRAIVTPSRIKALLCDNTWARYNDEGDFDGLLHSDPNGRGWVHIDYGHSLFANFDDDGLGNYNEPRLARAEDSYDDWLITNEAAKRFDEKIAGAIWVIHYPEGKQAKYKELTNVDNRAVAQDLAYQIKASGHLVIPSRLLASVNEQIENFGQAGWKIELIESSDKQAGFIERMDHLDKRKIRAIGVLERAITEGVYGTKAEAESHINLMLLNMQLKHEDLTDYFNREVVDQFTYLNWGVVSAVKFIAHPLADSKRELLTALFTQLLANPDTSLEITQSVSVQQLMKELKVPMLSEREIEERGGGMAGLFKIVGETGAGLQQQQQPAQVAVPQQVAAA